MYDKLATRNILKADKFKLQYTPSYESIHDRNCDGDAHKFDRVEISKAEDFEHLLACLSEAHARTDFLWSAIQPQSYKFVDRYDAAASFHDGAPCNDTEPVRDGDRYDSAGLGQSTIGQSLMNTMVDIKRTIKLVRSYGSRDES